MSKHTLLHVVFLCILVFSITSFSADDPVNDIHQLTMQWTRLERQKDLLRTNWHRDKPVLEQQLSLLERETQELNQFLKESSQEKDEVEKRRLELLEKQTNLEQEQEVLERSLKQANMQLKALHIQLPPPLFEGWGKDLPRLEDPLLTGSEKLQLVINLLRQLDDFQQKVTLNEIIMTLDDGKEYLVKQVFLGLSHGWYITADKRYAAAGMPNPDGWKWIPAENGEQISRIIAILERRTDPELVTIPLKLNSQKAEVK